MFLEDLKSEVESHSGTFLCERMSRREQTKVVTFSHVIGEPASSMEVPAMGRLQDFVDTFGSLLLYVDDQTGESAMHIASPSKWASLDSDFHDWIDQLNADERIEILPDWIDGCLVIGEEPKTGNYILMPIIGDEAGAVYFFDHDGFEFTRKANNVIHYVQRMLSPDDRLLRDMATHMRFVEDDPMIQWWIRELQDNRGNVASTAQ